MRFLPRLRRRRQSVTARLLPLGGPAFAHSEDVLEAIRLWRGLYGEPPTYTDWSRARATNRNDARALERMGESGDWPTSRQVVRRFGSFSAAIAAAGFTPRPAHRPRKTIAIGGASTPSSASSTTTII
jgi:hypothetical protein